MRPLPGQIGDEDLPEFVTDHFLAPMLMLLVIGSMCIVEWFHYWFHSPPSPWVYTIWFLGTAAIIAYHWVGQWRIAMAKKLGRDGERAVAEFINVWVSTDSRVLHNVMINGGVADHVMICRKGIFIVETKTRSFPRFGKPVVHINDSRLLVSGLPPDRDPIAQVRQYMAGLTRILSDLDAATKSVTALILFPGWEIVDDRTANSSIYILNPRDLDDGLRRRPDVLSVEQVSYLAKCIANHSIRHSGTPSATSPQPSDDRGTFRGSRVETSSAPARYDL